jgi:hypothetical protein
MPRFKRGLEMHVMRVERVCGDGLRSERASFMVFISPKNMLSPCFMRWSLLE